MKHETHSAVFSFGVFFGRQNLPAVLERLEKNIRCTARQASMYYLIANHSCRTFNCDVKKEISILLLSRMCFIRPYVERDIVQMKFTASAIMNWMFQKLVKARWMPPIHNQKGTLNQPQKDICISKTFQWIHAYSWLHFNEDKNMTCALHQLHSRSNSMPGNGR